MIWLRKIWKIGSVCIFHSLTGLYCPGCGGTRAVRTLLQGDLRMSVQYHPLVLYTVIAVLTEGIIRFLSKKRKHPLDHRKRERILILIGAAIVVINWIFKNYMLVVKGIDLLPPL
ncbi:uncharacterized protein DUF2752 [Lacrimispora xylanisolvens]|jgi:predicted small integral membrane protein|uniref:Uncharacterized protein DUF2752 n=1 Tax=Lacrimispora xylanisolvens TaxID=384636 RepID=A0A2S6HZK5_9FIRM|nr:DUF2752 domain-containing protein [Hungatella xylanolytica]MBE5988368.1 DUF2752 domain-containing protein [Paenibacillaceae bacterium]PPK83594.1 uncharacterized protein DUF2752 [Hungatella xylanolytica]